METWKFVVEIFQGISVIFAALVAIHGIDSWRREFQGKRQMELAEDTLALFYEAREAIMSIRSPFSYEGEGRTRKPLNEESPEQKESRDKAFVSFERYERHKELFSKLYAARVRFMANFGQEAAKPFDEISKVIRDVLNASRMLSGLYEDSARMERFGPDAKLRESIIAFEKIIWYMGPKEDKIEPRVNDAIEQIEKQCRAIMESRGTMYGFVNWVLPFKRKKQLPAAGQKALEKKT